ncbi:MAG: quinol:cytochrome C oxidoreductase [Chlorobi bacterium]|nr:quinol:cytochrome C oxidoreductase [Chlorobiota bacterium]
MEEKFTFSSKLKYFSFALMAIGAIAMAIAFMGDPQRAWADLLLNNFYFLSLAIGASFFLAIQYIAQAGWSSGFKRIPESMTLYIPIGAIVMVVLILGLKHIYPWINPGEHVKFDEHDLHLIDHKSPWLNLPFFIGRMILYLAVWTGMTFFLRKLSLKEDMEGGIEYFKKIEFYSKVYIFLLAFTFIGASLDWIMSIDPTWFSTLFAIKNFVLSFYHGAAMIILIAYLLNKNGHLTFMNKSHWHDFSKYQFFLAIMFGYMWYSQYFLIWYANIPEETSYYIQRREDFSQTLFVFNIVLNFVVPFVILIPNFMARNKHVLAVMAVVLLIGHYTDLYEQIMPGVTGKLQIGFVEIGSWLGFLGLFIFVVATTLSKANLIPKNHPLLDESLHHHLHS